MQNQVRIFVTGGAGFIGSNYLNFAVPRYPDYQFVNIDALTYAGNLDNVEVSKSPNYTFEKGDIRDEKTLQVLFKKHSPTHIVHFAAESHVDNSIASPNVFVETNILGTHRLLTEARKVGVERFLYISTDEVYGSLALEDAPSKEDDPMRPNSPYSASKASGELLARAYGKTYGMPVLITRCTNNYGPHQHREKLIPVVIGKIISGESVPIYGNGNNVRDWIHVEDHVRGLDMVLHGGTPGEIYNLGGQTELSNNEIAQKLIDVSGGTKSTIQYVTDRPGHDFRYALDISKIQKELGWKPKVPLDDGLRETFEWYTSHADSKKK